MGATLLDALVGDAAIAAWFGDAAEIAAMLAFEVALAEAQAECGLVPPEAAAAIALAAARYEPMLPELNRRMAADGVLGPGLVAALRADVGEPHGQWLHFQATSQDAVDTGLTLRLKSVATELDSRLQAVLARLLSLREAQGEVVLMGHTRMQRALPVAVADKIDSWTRPLQRHWQRLAELSQYLLVVQSGGPVGTRAGLAGLGDRVAAGLADRLGLGVAPCWHTARGPVVEFGQWLALVAGSLGKIGQDVALLVQNEVGAVRLAAGGASSAMRHKSNPVAAEVLVALARFTAGQAGTLAQAMVHEGERSGAAWTLEWMTLPPLAIAAGAALRHANALLSGLTFLTTSME